MDGCPTVRLSDDPNELETLLGFIYTGWKYVLSFRLIDFSDTSTSQLSRKPKLGCRQGPSSIGRQI